jgi:hypothetical protein
VRFGNSVGKYGTAREARGENLIRSKKGATCVSQNEGKYTDTLTEYLILIVFPRQKWLRERASMLLYTTLRVLLISVKINLHFWIF